MIIGGIANLVWGIPRSTQDIDISIWIEGRSRNRFIHSCKKRFKFRTNSPEGFADETSVLPILTKDGIPIDLILAQLQYEHKAIRRAVWKPFHGATMKVCSPEDLIILKIISERMKDREDVQGIIRKSRKHINRKYLDRHIRELAQALAKPEILKFYYSCWQTK